MVARCLPTGQARCCDFVPPRHPSPVCHVRSSQGTGVSAWGLRLIQSIKTCLALPASARKGPGSSEEEHKQNQSELHSHDLESIICLYIHTNIMLIMGTFPSFKYTYIHKEFDFGRYI